jgi:hypothetical protein
MKFLGALFALLVASVSAGYGALRLDRWGIQKIKDKVGYSRMAHGDTKTLFGKPNGELYLYQSNRRYQTNYGVFSMGIIVTKPLLINCPQITLLTEATMKQVKNSRGISFDMKELTAYAKATASCRGVKWEAGTDIAGGSVGFFDVQLGLGFGCAYGIVDDSIAVEYMGVGGTVGRKMSVSLPFGTVGVDLAKVIPKDHYAIKAAREAIQVMLCFSGDYGWTPKASHVRKCIKIPHTECAQNCWFNDWRHRDKRTMAMCWNQRYSYPFKLGWITWGKCYCSGCIKG